MTEETKKPRRKRRTKAQIEADKAAELAAKEEQAAVSSEKVAKEEPAVSVKPVVTKKEEYTPLTGLAKLRNKYAQRQKVDKGRGQ